MGLETWPLILVLDELFRRAKYESELRVKNSALVMAEMTQYLQFRQDELERLTKEIDDVIKQQNK